MVYAWLTSIPMAPADTMCCLLLAAREADRRPSELLLEVCVCGGVLTQCKKIAELCRSLARGQGSTVLMLRLIRAFWGLKFLL